MNRLFFVTCLLFALMLVSNLTAQINIVSVSFQPYNVTPEALLNVNIMNTEGEKQVQIFTQLLNSSNAVVLAVKSQPFKLGQGLSSGGAGNRSVASVEFGSSMQTAYLKNTHILPSGRYKVCCTLFISEDGYKTDEYCDEIEGDFNQSLYLINPFNEDTLDSRYPILSWIHNEPFSVLNQGESFRMVVAEIKESQSAEEAITVNIPVMLKNFVQEHQVQYPYDAKELKAGSQYAWQVQKISDGIVVNKTEAWKFSIRPPEKLREFKYVSLKEKVDGSFYTAYNGVAYFKFFEEYKNQGQLTYRLTDSKSKSIDIQVKKDGEGGKEEKSNPASMALLKKYGNNLYSIDLNTKKLGSGFYTLEVKNEKNESFYLKIFLP